MIKYIKLPIISLVLIVFGFFGCNQDEDPAAPISPAGYPVATFSTDLTASVIEGDIITYTITTDKMLDVGVDFTARQTGGTAVEHEDFEFGAVELAPYSTEIDLEIVILNDGVMDDTKSVSLEFEVGAFDLGNQYLLNPTTVNPTGSTTITNGNDRSLLIIELSWSDEAMDYDMVIWKDNPLIEHADGGATLANPEIDKSILTGESGTYFVNIMHWGQPNFEYTFKIGHTDGSIQTITGTFDSDNADAVYTNDPWTAWVGSYDSYRILKVVNDGNKFTVTTL